MCLGDGVGGRVDVCMWREVRGVWMWVWLRKDRVKIVIATFVSVNVSYDSHMNV